MPLDSTCKNVFLNMNANAFLPSHLDAKVNLLMCHAPMQTQQQAQ